MMINIVAPSRIDMLADVECNWVYADDNLEAFRLTRNALKKSAPLVSAEVFQQAALNLQASFVSWVDECMSATPRSYWLATPFSKNPLESHLFLHLVWMVLIDRAIKRGKSGVTVVTESHGLTLALTELCRIRGWECEHYGKINNFFRHVRQNFTVLSKWFGKLLLLFYRVAIAKCIFADKFVTTRLAATELLLESYVHDGDISGTGEFKDRYFPELMAYYRTHGVNAAYFPLLHRIPFWRLPKTYASMKRSSIPFAPFEALITFSDLALAAFTSLRHSVSVRLKTPLAFQGIPVGALIRVERFSAGLRSVLPFALMCAPRRMANAGIKPKYFIDWFENQPLDKGIVLGLKKDLPHCRTIAVRQYGFLTNFLSLLSSSGEVRAGVAPTENWVCGESLKSVISRFDTLGHYSAVPALRYAHLHLSPPFSMLGDTLLVLLTYSYEESMAILDCVMPLCMKENAVTPRFVVKTHPDINALLFRQKAEQRFPSLSMNTAEWSVAKLSELLPAARVVVTSGSSSAVEAVCSGIPVVLIGRHAGLNFNPLEEIDVKIWTVAYTPDEIKIAITEQFCEERLPISERLVIAENTRNTLFMKAGDAEMRRFLPTELKTGILQ